MVVANVVSEFQIGNAQIKIADNYCRKTACEVDRILKRIATQAQRQFNAAAAAGKYEQEQDDNGASLAGKGMDFQLRRLKKHLHDHYRRYGTQGGIYQFDFKGYFGSLPHDTIKARARAKIKDDRLYSLFCDYVDDFLKMKTADKAAERKHGVGLGSEISQIIALDFASPIDHYVKDVRGIHGYGRYMDDGYVISPSLAELADIKQCLYALAEELGIAMSDKKNIITPFRHHSFTFLKMRVTLRESGKVTMKLSRKSIKAMRRKLDIFRRWVDVGKLSPEDAIQSYQSWRAHAQRCNSYRTLRSILKLSSFLLSPLSSDVR